MKIPSFKRLNKNDYPEEFQDLVDQLSFVINDGFSALYDALDGKLSTDNSLEIIKDAQFQVSEDGIPQSRINCSLAGSKIHKVIGCSVIHIVNINNPILYPDAGVTVSWTQEGDSVVINHLTGLEANSPWLIRFHIIGSS